MKRILIILVYLSAVSCDKAIEVPSGLEKFIVSTEKSVYKVNEPVIFNLAGDPELISFYSGELQSDYNLRGTTRKVAIEKALLSFMSAYPTLANSQIPGFEVLVSNDFNDVYTYDNLINGGFRPITSNFAFGTSGTYVPSNEYDLIKEHVLGKPLYVAFRYTVQPQQLLGLPRRRLIQSFFLIGETPINEYVIGNMISSDFIKVEKDDQFSTISTLTTTTITFDSHKRASSTSPDPDTDTWVVSKAFELDSVYSDPIRPIVLKGNQDAVLRQHVHTYDRPGEYTVTFVGINANVSGKKEVVRQIKITVEN